MACELDRILTMNVPHIPEKIFLSLDFKSFMNCLEVCKSWNDLLISETYQTKTKNVFWREIHYMLNSAAARGNVNVIQRVLSSFIVDINQSSSLYLAANFAKKDVVHLLLERGADPNIKVDVHVGRQFVDEQFAQHTRDEFLFSVGKTGNQHMVKLLIPKEAGTNMVDETGMTPLITAAENGYKDVAELLLAGGANPNITDDRDGITPLFIAAYKGYRNMIKLLLNEGADINKGNHHGMTPLYWAAQHGFKRTVGLLLAEGADPNMADVDGVSPLLNAALNSYRDVIETLIANGADINMADLTGSTPLLLAAMEGHKDVAQLLLDKGADPNIADQVGNTPQSMAKQNGHMDVVYLIVKSGAIKDP